jgi:putative transposase
VARFAWNWGLATWNQKYLAGEKGMTGFGLVKEFNRTKHQKFPWTSEVSKWAPQKAIQNLGDAFVSFFQKKSKRPRFKKRGVARDSFYLECKHFKVDGWKLWIPKLGWVKMTQALRFPGTPKSVTISREGDSWFASFSIELPESYVYPHKCETQASVGVDLGLTTLATMSKPLQSTGETKLPGPKALRSATRKLRRANRAVTRKVKGSRNVRKAVVKLSRAHVQVKRIRQDAIHKLTTQLVKQFSLIGIERLNVRGMMRNRKLARSVSDAAFFEIRRQLEYKSKLSGSEVVVANQWFPSSKMCHCCGHIYKELTISEREWECSACHARHDRDENAAKNLEWFAQMFVALGHRETLNACGEEIRPQSLHALRHPSVKQESMQNLELELTL